MENNAVKSCDYEVSAVEVPALEITILEVPTLEMDIEVPEHKAPDYTREIKLSPTIRTESLADDDLVRKQKALNNIDAFTKPYQRRELDDRNIQDRGQHSLDNFHLPAYTCALPKVDNLDAVSQHYDRASIAILDNDLKNYFHCINRAAETERDSFVQLITGKLDGQIVMRKNNRLQWAVLPKYTEQTQNIMHHINQQYQYRYADYQATFEQLQHVIKQWTRHEALKSQ
ncbi:MAG: hypothetical protein HKN88_09565 [Gammaproteobacteria bacterium]|nr:hypothetical protein [Gammaproteobacteria bacterium]NNC98304.1 hypothetical protein [Gammaproteobacteria bacterium]NNM12780.1 hypothetical protein [Gammaproteobacteria bacterium]